MFSFSCRSWGRKPEPTAGPNRKQQRSLIGEQDAERQGLREALGFRCRAGAQGARSRPGTCSQVFSTLPVALTASSYRPNCCSS